MDMIASMEMQIEKKLAASPHISRQETTTLSDADRICQIAIERKHILPRSRREGPKRQRARLEDVVENRLHMEEKITVRDPAKIDLSPCHICHRKPTEKKHLNDFAYCEGCGKRTCFICIRQCEVELGRERGGYPEIEAFGTDAGYDQLTFSFHGDEMCFERERREIDETLFTGPSWEKDRRAGHPKKVCSRCCVERGVEGEVWCLGCLRVAEVD